jgi:hypothetical protein
MRAYLIAGLFAMSGFAVGCSDMDFDDDDHHHDRTEYRTREVHHHYDDDRGVRGTDHDRAHRKVYREGDRSDIRRHNQRWH